MMKKSIFAVAVASVLTLGAAQAETVLYGSIRYDYENKKVENTPTQDPTTGRINWSGDRVSNLEDAGSRIGVKGSEDLGNGNAVIYNLEFGFNGMTQDESKGGKTRLAVLGLTGNWGTFTAGRQHNPFKVTIVDDSIQDDFNGSNVISSASQRAMTTTLTGANASGYKALFDANGNEIGSDIDFIQADVKAVTDSSFSRVGKVIAYTTPEFAGFQANAALMMDDKNNNEKHVDLWTINARYAYEFANAGTLLAKAGYIQGKTADENKSKVWGLFLGYKQDAFGVTASYADGNHKAFMGEGLPDGSKEKSKGWDVGASFSFGPNYYSTIRATYGQNELKVDGEKDKVKSWAVGFEQKLSSRTRAWVEYGQEEVKFANITNSDKKKDNVVSIGMRHDF